MPPPDKIVTDRLVIRRFVRRDAEAIVDAVHSSLPDLQQWLPWAHTDYARDDASAYIRDSVQSWKEGRAFDFAIRSTDDPGRHLGNVSIWHVSRLGKVGEIGYWVRTDATSKGIASEATDAMLSLGFSTLHLHKVTLRIAVGNDASIRVAEKLGFTREGILREELRINGTWVDHILYSMLAHEYSPLGSRSQTA